MVVGSPDDLVAAVSRDRRMAGYGVRRQGGGWIEVEGGAQRARVGGLLCRAWGGLVVVAVGPERGRRPLPLPPHLARPRSGNYGLIIAGNDDELEAAQL